MITVTSTPVQSAMALPKNEPRCVDGSDKMYDTISKTTIASAPRLSECLRRNDDLRTGLGFALGAGVEFELMQILYSVPDVQRLLMKPEPVQSGITNY